MGSPLVVADASASAIITASGFDRAQVELIKNTVAVGATDMELALFLQTAKHRGLDVFARQIHFVKRNSRRKNPKTGQWEDVSVGTMQTGIDGFRLIADRTGKYHGQDEAEFEYEADGKTLRRATVRAYRSDIPRPFVGTAYWREYAEFDQDGKPRSMWKRMPHVMLAKAAEAIALRKAFPENLSGLYADDEMPAIEGEAVVHDQRQTARPTGTVRRIQTQEESAVSHASQQPVSATEAPIESPGNGSQSVATPASDMEAVKHRRATLQQLYALFDVDPYDKDKAVHRALIEAVALELRMDEPPAKWSEIPVAQLEAFIARRQAAPKTAELEETRAVTPSSGAPAARKTSETDDAIIAFLTENNISNEDNDLQSDCLQITSNSERGVRYDWHSLDEAEKVELLARMRAWNLAPAEFDDEAIL